MRKVKTVNLYKLTIAFDSNTDNNNYFSFA